MAAVGHGLTFVEGGIIGPLILYLVQKDKDAFSAFHSLQSLYWGLAMIVLCTFAGGITIVTLGLGAILFLPIVGIYMVFEVIATIKAYHGEWYMLPIVGELALKSHPPGSSETS
jgi:uncharacterized membrane protein